MVQTLEMRLFQRINMMFNAIAWEKQTEQGLWDQVILVNANKEETGS